MKAQRFLRRIAVISLCLIIVLGAPARCEQEAQSGIVAGDDASHIEELTGRILVKQIDLERYYSLYGSAAAKEPKTRHLRYFLLQQAAAGLFLGSSAATVRETGKNLRTPDDVSSRVLKGTYVTGIIGSVVQGASSGLELCSNGLIALKNKLKKNDPESTRRTFVARLREVDALLAERSAIVERSKGSAAFQLFDIESKLLTLFRDWSVYEFADIYADIKSNQASSNMYYVLDVTGSSFYLASYIAAIKSLEDTAFSGPSAIEGIVGDALGIVAAPGYQIAYYKMYDFWKRRLSRQLKEKIYDAEPKVKEMMGVFETAIKGADEGNSALTGIMSARLAMYRLWAQRYDEYTERYMIDLRRLNKVALQGSVSGPLISGGFLAQDIIGVVAAYRLRNNSVAANTNSFAAAIPPTVASGVSLALSSYWFAGDQLHKRNLERNKASPAQLLDQRLKTLDELEGMLGKPAR